MPDRIFLTSDRCGNEHQGAPDKNGRLWDPEYAIPVVRDGDYRRSEARYGKPVDVWKSALTRGREFTLGLGAETSSELESWRTYAPETEHERRTRANAAARSALVGWFENSESPRLREAFVGAAAESVQFRRLMMRYGLDGSGPRTLNALAKEEGVRWDTVRDSIAAATASLPALSTAVEHAGLMALAVQTVRMAEETKPVVDSGLDGGGADTPLYIEERYSEQDIQTVKRGSNTDIMFKDGAAVWSSDQHNHRSLRDIETDGWIARSDGLKETACPFYQSKPRKAWYRGYRKAAEEFAARAKAGISDRIAWSSSARGGPSLMDAYTDGWMARHESADESVCPFYRNSAEEKALRSKWLLGYNEAAAQQQGRPFLILTGAHMRTATEAK